MLGCFFLNCLLLVQLEAVVVGAVVEFAAAVVTGYGAA